MVSGGSLMLDSHEKTMVCRGGRLEWLFPQWFLHGGWLGQNVWIVKPGSNSKGSGIESGRKEKF